MEENNMNEMNSYKNVQNNNSFLPNIRLNNTSQKEKNNKYFERRSNNPNININEIDIENNNNNNDINFQEKNNNINNISFTPYNRDNYALKKYNSQMDLFNNNEYNENFIMNNTNSTYNEEDFSDFLGKIKIYNFYSSIEIIILIEKILKELNFKKNYSFTIKDSLMTFSFGNANKALAVFKKLNKEKLTNKLYRNLMVDINLDIKNINNNKNNVNINNNNNININNNNLGKDKMMNQSKAEQEKMLFNMLSPQKNKSKEINMVNIARNLKSYNASKENTVDKYFEGIYGNYIEYFKKRKEERRKKELSYIKGKNYSLQASTPYVENDNRNIFFDSLRKYKGNNISPARFNGYIDKASISPI